MVRKKRVIAMFPEYFLDELEASHEIQIDSIGRVRGFPAFIERLYLRNKKKGGGF